MKNKKKKLISVIAVVIAVVLAAGLPMIQRAAGRNSYLKVIRNNWGLSLPAGCVEVYEIDSGPSFHGDGERYHVFKYREGKEVPVWGNAEGLRDADRKRIVEILDGLDGKKEWYPDFESVTDMGKDKKQDGSCVYFLFDGEAARRMWLKGLFNDCRRTGRDEGKYTHTFYKGAFGFYVFCRDCGNGDAAGFREDLRVFQFLF